MKSKNLWYLMMVVLFLPVGPLLGMDIDVTQPPYNAIPNDGVSDRAAIQAAINDLTEEGGTIYFPPGVYDLDGDLLVYDANTMPQQMVDKPVFLKGSTYGGSGLGSNPGSVLRRISAGNILRVDLNGSGYGYWYYSKLSVSDLCFQGDPGHTNQVTAIRGYRVRMNLQNVSFEDCYNGVHLDAVRWDGEVDYTDLSYFSNLRFYHGWGGDGIRIKGADSTAISGVSMEECTFTNGIYFISAGGAYLNNLLINGCTWGIQLGWCRGIMISGWNSKNLARGLYTIACEGISVDGFNFEGNDCIRFYLCGDTIGTKIRNGRIRGVGGYDLNIFDTSRNTEFDNVQLYDASGVSRGLLASATWLAIGKLADTTSDLYGVPFVQLKDPNCPGNVFQVDGTGQLSMNFPGATTADVPILSGYGAPTDPNYPVGSLYLNANGGSRTTLYVRESSGWVAK